MSADRKFTHRGVTVLIWSKSIKITGMHDNIYLGAAPDDDQIKRMIDAIQRAAESPAQAAWTRHNNPPRRLSMRERFLRWWYGL